MKSAAIPLALSAVVLAVAGAAAGYNLYQARSAMQQERADADTVVAGLTAAEADSPAEAEDFTLTERSGETFDSASLDGKVWAVNFFFASCQFSCHELSSRIKALHDDPRFADVTFVSITTDPANDTPEVLREYADQFKADPERWLFLTGDADEIAKIGEGFLVSAVGPQHSERAIVIDRSGKVRGRFVVTDSATGSQMAQLQVVLKDVLKESAEQE